MTEDHATSLWCPLARASDMGDSPITINRIRVLQPDPDCYCLASKCMAWRWRAERDGQHREGYCGAFGKPEAI